MNKKALFPVFLVLFFLFPVRASAQQIEEDITFVSAALHGRASCVFVHQGFCYVSRGSKLLILDTSDPSDLKLRGSIFSPGTIVDLFVSGHYAYLCKYGRGLVVVDISDPDDPKEVSALPLEDYPKAIYVADGRAYLLTQRISLYFTPGDDRIRIIDVSDPLHPAEFSSFDFGVSLSDIHVSGGLACVSAGGLRVIDVSDPQNAVEVGSYTTGGSSNVNVRGSLAYLTTRDGLEVIDISDPVRPGKLGELALSGGTPADVELSEDGRYACVVVASNKLVVVDVRDPSSPKEVGCHYAKANDVCVSDNLAYLAARHQGLRVIDLSEPTRPEVISSYQAGDVAHGVWVSNDYAYVAYGLGGLKILNVSDPSDPKEVGGWCRTTEGSFDVGIEAVHVCVSGHFAYLIEQGGGLSVIEVSNPGKAGRVGFCTIQGMNRPQQIKVSGTYAYVVGGLGTVLAVVDVSDPTAPRQVSSYPGMTASSIYLVDRLAYLRMDTGSKSVIKILDVSDPANLMEIGEYAPFPEEVPRITNVFVSGNYLYVGGSHFSPEDYDFSLDFYVVDVSNPSQPKEVGYLSIPGGGMSSCGLYVLGKYAYIRALCYAGYAGLALRVIDLSDPAHPVDMGSRYVITLSSYKSNDEGLYGSGNLLYVAAYSDGLYILRSDLGSTRIEEAQESLSLPGRFYLSQNWPNPFNTETILSFRIPEEGRVTLKVYDLLGQEVRTLVSGTLRAGEHRVHWDGRNEVGRPVGSGIYFCRIVTNDGSWSETRKMLLLQ